MADPDSIAYTSLLFAFWGCYSLSRIAARAKGMADDLAALRRRAEGSRP